MDVTIGEGLREKKRVEVWERWYGNAEIGKDAYRILIKKTKFDVDHIIPESLGGNDDLINLQPMDPMTNQATLGATLWKKRFMSGRNKYKLVRNMSYLGIKKRCKSEQDACRIYLILSLCKKKAIKANEVDSLLKGIVEGDVTIIKRVLNIAKGVEFSNN